MRPEILPGHTHKVKIALEQGDLAFYVTVNTVDGNPWEVFVNCRDARYWEHLTVATVGISRQLQAGIPLQTIVEDLKSIHSPITGHFNKGYISSIYARIVMESGRENSNGHE